MKPHYADDRTTIYHGDCREVLSRLPRLLQADFVWLVMDPPYGIDYQSGSRRDTLAASIQGDKDTSLRDEILARWGDGPALVFGSWKIARPAGTHTRLIWDTKGALGMGDLSVPWKPSDQEIYVLGHGFAGPRTSNVLRYAPVQSMARNGRLHPHEKPVSLMRDLIAKCPGGLILDPFMGSGSTLVAARQLGRRAVGIEIDAGYCATAVDRLGRETSIFDGLDEAA